MANPKRSQDDIRNMNVSLGTCSHDAPAWLVEVNYTDGKSVEFAIDRGKNPDEDMMQRLHDCIVKQLKGSSV